MYFSKKWDSIYRKILSIKSTGSHHHGRAVNIEKQCTILYFYLGGGNNTVSSYFNPWLSFQMSHSTQINAFVWVETY